MNDFGRRLINKYNIEMTNEMETLLHKDPRKFAENLLQKSNSDGIPNFKVNDIGLY